MSKRNVNTYHPRKSARRQRALDRLPALVDMPTPPEAPKKAKPVKRGGRPKIDAAGVATEAPLTTHERDLLEAERRNYDRALAYANRKNARVLAERAILESRIGKPPRHWPKRERVVAMKPELAAPYRGDGEDLPEWDAYMSIPKAA